MKIVIPSKDHANSHSIDKHTDEDELNHHAMIEEHYGNEDVYMAPMHH